MIAFAYNDVPGGILEYELRMANSTEVRLGLKYMAERGNRFISSSILSTGAHSPDGLTVLYLDQLDSRLPIRNHNSFVNAANVNPWGGISLDPNGVHVSFAGYGPKQKLLYAVYSGRGSFLDPPGRWHLYLGPGPLTETPGFSPVYAPDLGRMFFVEAGETDTIRAIEEVGRDESVVKQFKGSWIRSLAITQNRSRSKWAPLGVGEELIVSVYDPNTGKSSIHTGSDSGFAMTFKKRFEVGSDWVMIAGTGIFGGGTHILFTSGQDLRIWDERDGSVNAIQEWKTDDGIKHYSVPIPPFRHNIQGSGLAISPEASKKVGKRKKSAKGNEVD
jgi:hypothetical protein